MAHNNLPTPTRAEIEHAAAALLLGIINDFQSVLRDSRDVIPIALAIRLVPVMTKALTVMELLRDQLEVVDLKEAAAIILRARGAPRLQ